MPSEPATRKSAMSTPKSKTAGEFEMPSEPASRKTALVTPKSQKPISEEQLDFVVAADLRTLRTYFLNGEFRKANNFLHEKILKEGVSQE